MLKMIISLMFIISVNAYSQNLNNIKIRNIEDKKTSVYVNEGIFHHRAKKQKTTLKKIRQNFTAKRGYERIVFDFATQEIPNIYGHIDSDGHKITFDMMFTEVKSGINAFGKKEFVKSVDFFPVSKDTVSVEIVLSKKVKTEVFRLPSKLVFDFMAL